MQQLEADAMSGEQNAMGVRRPVEPMIVSEASVPNNVLFVQNLPANWNADQVRTIFQR
jgi:hypothetical protein